MARQEVLLGGEVPATGGTRPP